MYFYEILESIMAKKNLSVPEVARLCGLRDSTVRSIISRKNKTIALEVAFKLAKGLNVSIEELNGEKFIPYKTDESLEDDDSKQPNNEKYSVLSRKGLMYQIKKEYGTSAFQALELYTQLDSDDQGEIRGEMKHMLKAEKYSAKEESNYA